MAKKKRKEKDTTNVNLINAEVQKWELNCKTKIEEILRYIQHLQDTKFQGVKGFP